MKEYDIIFPNLFRGIRIEHIDPVAFRIFGIEIYWYALIITTGILAGYYLALYRAKKMGVNPDIISDFVLYAVVMAVIGARIYYVIFAWKEFQDDWLQIFNLRSGGLAIYGAIIGAALALYFYGKKKRVSFLKVADVAAPGLLLGQIIGRWGNFMNMEAFGGATDSVFAMALRWDKVKYIPESLQSHGVMIDGIKYLQVQPTFFYESAFNLMVLLFLLYWTRKRKWDGEILCLYFLGYSLVRVWVEGLRTDQLLLPVTGLPVSQVLSGVLIVFCLLWYFLKRKSTARLG